MGKQDRTEKVRGWYLKTPIKSWHCHVQGRCIEVTRKLLYSRFPDDNKRGPITTFTPESRMKMLRATARIDWKKVGKSVFVSLTYPDQHIERSYKERSKQRSLMARYIEKYADKKISLIWRCEWKARRSGMYKGMIVPHFHLIVCGVRYLPKALVRRWWRIVLGAKGPLCTDVRALKGEEGAARYLAKYLSKSDALDRAAYLNNPYSMGRHWGITRSKLIPRMPIDVDKPINGDELKFAQEEAKKVRQRYDEKIDGGFTIFGDAEAKRFVKRLVKSC